MTQFQMPMVRAAYWWWVKEDGTLTPEARSFARFLDRQQRQECSILRRQILEGDTAGMDGNVARKWWDRFAREGV